MSDTTLTGYRALEESYHAVKIDLGYSAKMILIKVAAIFLNDVYKILRFEIC